MRIINIFCQIAGEPSIQFISVFFVIILALLLSHNWVTYGYKNDNILDYQSLQKFSFVAAGDFGCGDEPHRTVDGMMKKNPKFVLALGDLSYKKSINCWLRTVSPLDSEGKIKISFGEHDLNNNLTKYNELMKYFNMTKPYYSFDYGNVHFFAMATGKNSITPYQNGSEQYNFVKEDLRNAHDNKSIDWIIVYSFRPFYSSLTEHSGQEVLPSFVV